MSRFKARLERLEKLQPPIKYQGIEWANFQRHPDDWVFDGLLDWEALRQPAEPWRRENCAMEKLLAAKIRELETEQRDES